MERIGKTIQTLRRNKNITQAQLAEALSVSAQSVSKWENHLSMPDISLLPMIARYFGITMDELFGYRLDALNARERFMADNGVLQFGSFRLRCGRRSPYLINTGHYQSASQIYKLGEFYVQCIRENNVEASVLVGNTPRDIPVMVATSMVLFSRYGVDLHYGDDGSIGKKPEAGDRVVLIKDTLTTGQTLRENLQKIRHETGRCVSDIIVSVDRMERGSSQTASAAQELAQKYGARVHAIVTLDDIIRAVESGIAGSAEQLDALREYRQRYGGTDCGH